MHITILLQKRKIIVKYRNIIYNNRKEKTREKGGENIKMSQNAKTIDTVRERERERATL